MFFAFWACVVVFVLAITLFLYWWGDGRKVGSTKPVLLITLLGTLAGVFLACFANEYFKEKSEKQYLMNVYAVMTYDLVSQKNSLNNFIDSNIKSKDINFKYISMCMIPQTNNILLTTPHLFRYMSFPGQLSLTYFSDRYKYIKYLFDDSRNDIMKIFVINCLIHEIDNQINFIKLEMEYLNGKRKEEEVKVIYDSMVNDRNQYMINLATHVSNVLKKIK